MAKRIQEAPDFDEIDTSLTPDIDDPDVLSRIREIMSGSETDYFATGFGELREQRLRTSITRPLGGLASDKVIVTSLPWSDDGGRPENYMFDAMTADATGLPVVRVNSPGIDDIRFRPEREHFVPHGISLEQRHELITTGSFKKTGRAVLAAALQSIAATGIDKPEVILAGQSMGVAHAGALVGAASEVGVPIVGMSLSETANATKRSVRELATVMSQEFTHQDAYLDEMPKALRDIWESPMNYNRRLARGVFGNLIYGAAIARGTLFADADDFEYLADRPGMPVLLTSGGQSRVSTDIGDNGMMSRFRNAGADAERRHMKTQSHPYSFYFPAQVNDIARVAA